MESLIKQINFDIKAIDYLKAITAEISPYNIQTARTCFNNNPDDLLDAIISIDEVRKCTKNAVILQAKVKRFNKRRKKA
jgi:hypothetical protein